MSNSSCLGCYPALHQTSTTVLGCWCWLRLPAITGRSPHTPVVNPPRAAVPPLKSRQHRAGHGKVNKHCPVPCQSPVTSFCFFFLPLGHFWFPEINYSTGDDSQCIAALLEQRIKRHIGHSSCTSQTLKFKIFINDLLKL